MRRRTIGRTSYGWGRSRHWHSARVGRPVAGTPCLELPRWLPPPLRSRASWRRRARCATCIPVEVVPRCTGRVACLTIGSPPN